MKYKTRLWTLRAILWFSFGVGINLVIDQVTKVLAEDRLLLASNPANLREYEQDRYFLSHLGDLPSPENPNPHFSVEFALTYVRNQGAAWGFMNDLADHIRIPFFYLVSLIALFMIGRYLMSTPKDQGLVRFSLMLILSGALGNLIDRVRLGYVIDFLDVKWALPLPFTDMVWRYDYPKFNWADSCICVGVAFLLIDMFFFEAKRQKPSTLEMLKK